VQFQSIFYASVIAVVLASGASAQGTTGPNAAQASREGIFTPITHNPTTVQGQAQNVTLRGFSITLLLGDTKPGPSSDVPVAAAKALADLKDFLPYKSFKVLDTQWAAGSDGGRLHIPLHDSTGGVEYSLFTTISSKLPTLYLNNLSLVRLGPPVGTSRTATVTNLIDTAVTMSLGETTVVGSSRVQSNTAVILLITAVPSQGR
jgi:hypothetical protein